MLGSIRSATADFFISYTAADKVWAEWIAWVLEHAGYRVVIQEWDFAAGSNFVLEMQEAASRATRTIAVLSPEYLTDSRFGAAEWAAAFSRDPDGMKRALVPVRVRDCAANGLLKSIVYIDLVGLDEGGAEERLLNSLKEGRRKPAARPAFPGAAGPSGPPPSPATAAAPAAPSGRSTYMPKIRGVITDLDRRRFIRDAFATIQQQFQAALMGLSRQSRDVEVDLVPIDATKFTAEIFVAGKSRARCKVWIGGLTGGNEIAYAEGSTSQHSNSMNEALSLTDRTGELALHTLMGMFSGRLDDGLDLQNLSADDAAEYLWRRFSSDLER
jgi:hypothetical protein